MDALNALSNRTAVTSAVKRVSPVVQMLVPAMGNANPQTVDKRELLIYSHLSAAQECQQCEQHTPIDIVVR